MFACMYGCITTFSGTSGGQERVSDPLEREREMLVCGINHNSSVEVPSTLQILGTDLGGQAGQQVPLLGHLAGSFCGSSIPMFTPTPSLHS